MLIAFTSSDSITTAGGGTCNAIHIYRFWSDASGGNHLQKAEQTDCGTSVGGSDSDFTDVISPTDLSLTNHELGVFYDTNPSAHYPMAFIRLTGYAGTQEKNKTYVDIETVVSSRQEQ